MTAMGHKSDFELTKDIPYLALMGELWGVYNEDLCETWLCYINVREDNYSNV